MALLLTVSIHSLLQIPLIKGGKNKEPGKILLILFSLTFSIRSLFPQNSNQMARMVATMEICNGTSNMGPCSWFVQVSKPCVKRMKIVSVDTDDLRKTKMG